MPHATEQQTKRKRDSHAGTISCYERESLQAKQDGSSGSSLASQRANDDYLTRYQQQARHTYTLPPGVNSDGLSEKQIARGNFYLQPADRYTKRQQDLLDMDEDNGSEDSWTYCKDDRDSQAAKNSIEKEKIRVLNMNQKQVLQRYKRMKQRKALLQSNPRQSLQAKQDASCSSSLASQRANNDYLARCQQQFRHAYTLSPGVNSDGLSEKQIARGNFYLRPNDRYTKRQQDLLDMDEDNGSEDSWTYCKDESSS